jgi:hypothetical protein
MSMAIACNTEAIPNAQGRCEAKEVKVGDLEAPECMGIEDGDDGNTDKETYPCGDQGWDAKSSS